MGFNNLIKKINLSKKGTGFYYIKNTSFITFSKIIENLAAYFIIILISRYLGAEGLGQYSFIFAFVGIFCLFADFGLSEMMVKDLSKNFSKINKYLSSLFSLKLILTFISFLIYFVCLFFIGKKEIFLALVLVGIMQIITIFQGVFYNILRIKHSGRKIMIVNIVERVIALLGVLIILPLTKSLTLLVLIFLISNLMKSIILFMFTKKYFKINLDFDFKPLINLIKKSLPFMLIGFFATIYIQMDSIMLSFMQGDVIVGFYNAGYKLINVLSIIPFILLTFGFPLFAKLFNSDKKALKRLFEKILYYSMVLIFPITIGVFYLGRRLLEFIYNFNSIEAATAFNILIVAEIFIFLTIILGQFIVAANKQKVFAYIGGIGAFVNIALNFILIPKYSLYGAGIATLITYVLMFVLMYFFIKKNLLKFNFFRYLIVPLIGTFIMWLILINILHLHLLLIILICAVVYVCLIGGWELVKLRKKSKVI